MKKRLSAMLAAILLFLFAGCSSSSALDKEESLHVLATTYPVYLFASAVTQDVEGVEVTLLVNSQTSCLHDYTLTVTDMKAIERADVIVMNGVGLEDFMSDALAQSEAMVIDCSEGIDLLPALEHAGHDGHDHEEEYDPHIWMDPGRAARMVENIGSGLALADPGHAQSYTEQAQSASFLLQNRKSVLRDGIASDQPDMQLPHRELITFHDGFQYFADAFDLTILKAIEEEEGSEASAADIREIVSLIGEYRLPAIFTEKNGSDFTAQAISREPGIQVHTLDMLMSGPTGGSESPLSLYDEAITANIRTIINALGEGKVTMQ